jgi:hypothetical protein
MWFFSFGIRFQLLHLLVSLAMNDTKAFGVFDCQIWLIWVVDDAKYINLD